MDRNKNPDSKENDTKKKFNCVKNYNNDLNCCPREMSIEF